MKQRLESHFFFITLLVYSLHVNKLRDIIHRAATRPGWQTQAFEGSVWDTAVWSDGVRHRCLKRLCQTQVFEATVSDTAVWSDCVRHSCLKRLCQTQVFEATVSDTGVWSDCLRHWCFKEPSESQTQTNTGLDVEYCNIYSSFWITAAHTLTF